VLITDIIKMFKEPGWQTVVQFFVDILYFFLLPIFGGVMAQSALFNYQLDELTYVHANLTRRSLWVPLMSLIKNLLYGVLGRPLEFDVNALDSATAGAIDKIFDSTVDIIDKFIPDKETDTVIDDGSATDSTDTTPDTSTDSSTNIDGTPSNSNADIDSIKDELNNGS
jgi:hypothetical protein